MDETVRRCAEIIESGGPAQHVAVNVAKIVALRDDQRLRAIVEGCDLVSVDGQPVVWASRLLGDPLPERVAGIDLMLRLLELAEERGYRVFILGAKQDVLETAVARLGERYPRLTVAGSHHGYFDDAESAAVCDASAPPSRTSSSSPCPRRARSTGSPSSGRPRRPLLMGVGGSIDVVAGVTKRAPA